MLTMLARRRSRAIRITPSAGIGGFGMNHSFVMARLCIFCGSSSGHDPELSKLAHDAAVAVVEAGFGVVYGGGNVGLMGAVADGAIAAGGEIIGVIPKALAKREIAHEGVSMLHVVERMHERKAMMVDLSDGFIALPGGYGTMDEFHEVLTWRQLRLHDKQIGLLNTRGFYDPLLAQFERMQNDGFLHGESRKLFVTAPTIEELLPLLFP
jgi:uncharacterized protein (TIGR00730 family)